MKAYKIAIFCRLFLWNKFLEKIYFREKFSNLHNNLQSNL
jgi:hypothetical protein